MKKILMALAILGICHFSADAQSKSKYDKNYKICMTNNGYNVCNSPSQKNKNVGRTVEQESPDASLRMMDTYVHLGYAKQGTGMARSSRMRVTYDDPNAPYQGEESMINDGVQKNINRNINYLDQSVVLPPNDGGVSNRHH